MYDYGLGVLEQYGLTASASRKGRGTLICETDQGLKTIREYHGSLDKLRLQREIQLQAEKAGILTDLLLLNQEGEPASLHQDGQIYTVRNWFYGKECDTHSVEDICRSVETLACFHKEVRVSMGEEQGTNSLLCEYMRHNREMRSVQKYLKRKKKKTDFERNLFRETDFYLQQGMEATEKLNASSYEKLRGQAAREGCICHGDCNQHNILNVNEKIALINFEKWQVGPQVADLYELMRKVLEKHNWDIRLAKNMVQAYNRVRPLDDLEWENLQIRLMYPWRFWKLINFYANNSKVWISEKTEEKLEKLINQREKWVAFMENIRL